MKLKSMNLLPLRLSLHCRKVCYSGVSVRGGASSSSDSMNEIKDSMKESILVKFQEAFAKIMSSLRISEFAYKMAKEIKI